jgi:hypothetical protein
VFAGEDDWSCRPGTEQMVGGGIYRPCGDISSNMFRVVQYYNDPSLISSDVGLNDYRFEIRYASYVIEEHTGIRRSV